MVSTRRSNSDKTQRAYQVGDKVEVGIDVPCQAYVGSAWTPLQASSTIVSRPL
jgi:hypothetical protein